ncbi:2-polyprenyl-6-methoxyphenol hydroxylase [Arthrobacter sp. 49Tsu3.1M3]|jgi:2-polyprenyl-6-methoxyphenol hydroxylase-like FAD-dependent oxidoreductase|nr:2-polyprenyl-6-methoxyphenol hydroxylase [Arthrobacter sp. 49Tsu3.1M3]
MWPAAQRALGDLGILDAVREASPVIDGMTVRAASGRPWTSAQATGLIGVSRVDLIRLLDGAVPGSVRRVAGRLDVVRPGPAGLVVGADGVHSAVRRSCWGARSGARPTRYLAVRGVVPGALWRAHTGEYWGRGQLFGIGPAAAGTNWYAAFRSRAEHGSLDVAAVLAETRVRYSGYAPGVRDVLAVAVPETTLVQRIWTTPPLGSYVRARVALLGDAAHAMTPNLGRGACEALVDAVTLAALLNTRPVDEALSAYNRARHLRTQALRWASSAVMRLALAERGQPVRDALLGLASPGPGSRSDGASESGPGRR